MSSAEIQNLIKNDRLQLFLLECPCNIPLNFANHHWFVINRYGVLSRWELLFRKHATETSWGHLNRDAYLPLQGIEIFPFTSAYHWNPKLTGWTEGDENSTVKKAIDFIENSANEYPYCYKYSLFGPNSNTYIQWIIEKFPELNMRLPFNSFGKNYSESKHN